MKTPTLLLASLAALAISCSSTGANKDLAQSTFDDLWTGYDLDVADETHTADFTWRENSNETSGREAYQAFVTAYKTAFPDLSFEMNDMIAEGDKVVVYWTATGTHRGYLMGHPPTNRTASVEGISIMRVTEGRISQEWTAWDEAGLIEQLGLGQ